MTDMRIISKKTLTDYGANHASALQPLLAWHDEALKATWVTPQDIKNKYSSASFLQNNRVVFNIKGNIYRLVVSISYTYGTVYIKFIGTHAEYNKINAETI